VYAGEVLDAMVATVNTRVILQSDWDDEVRFECFMAGRNLADVSFSDRKSALDRVIDQEILREQMHMTDLQPARAEEIKKQIDGLKSDQLREHPGESWAAALSRYHLTEKQVEDRVASELEQFQFIDARFRPSIQVSETEIEQYYREKVVPKLPASGPLSLAAAAPQIREVLVQEKMNQLLNSWLKTLRSQTQIRILSSHETSNSKAGQARIQ
jgi:hypothetical protein